MSLAAAVTGAGLTAGWLAVGSLAEKRARDAADSVPIRILVGGGRGKSTLVRLIHRGLRASGLSAVGRTTGDEPALLLPDGTRETLLRRGQANVRELRRDLLRAARMNAEAAVFENMAVQPELQELAAHRLFPPTLAVFAPDVRDHLEVLPEDSVERAALALSSVPSGTETAHCESDTRTAEAAKSLGLEAISFPAADAPVLRSGYMAVLAGAAIGAVRRVTNADDKAVEDAILDEAAKFDGVAATVVEGTAWIDLLSANDPETTWSQLSLLESEAKNRGYSVRRVIFFHRRDRVPRLIDFAELLRRWRPVQIAGDAAPLNAVGLRGVAHLGAKPEALAAAARSGEAVFCIGNSGGFGRAFREWLAARGESQRW